MKILLVYANYPMEPLLPLGIAYLSTVLEDNGYEVQIFDTTLYPSNEYNDQSARVISQQIKDADYSKVGVFPKTTDMANDFYAKVANFSPDLIGVSCVEMTYRIALCLLEKIDHLDIPVILGGVFGTFAPEYILKNSMIDMVCVGEGEQAILDVAKRIGACKSLNNIPNIITRDNKKNVIIKYNLSRIEELPIPRFNFFPKERLYRSMAGKIYKMIPIEISRGCPYMCTYCSAPVYKEKFKDTGKWLRSKSVNQIINEIDYYVNNTEVDYFYFISETFLAQPKEYRKEFYHRYAKYQIPFWFNTRPETITEWDINNLQEVGCHRISIGIESGNEEYRKKTLFRNYSNRTVLKAMEIMSRSHIQYSVNNMIGFPDETREMIFDTIELNRKFNADSHTVSVFQPYRGTKLYDYCVQKGYWDPNLLCDNDFSVSVLKMDSISSDEISGIYRTFNLYRTMKKDRWPEIKIAEKNTKEGNDIFTQLLSEEM